jgi:hypothetical protein
MTPNASYTPGRSHWLDRRQLLGQMGTGLGGVALAAVRGLFSRSLDLLGAAGARYRVGCWIRRAGRRAEVCLSSLT